MDEKRMCFRRMSSVNYLYLVVTEFYNWWLLKFDIIIISDKVKEHQNISLPIYDV